MSLFGLFVGAHVAKSTLKTVSKAGKSLTGPKRRKSKKRKARRRSNNGGIFR